jgi:hypothetical protein
MQKRRSVDLRLRLSKKWLCHFFEKAAACRSALVVRQRRTTRTFAGRNVFSPTHMSPEKMLSLYFAATAAKLCEAF